jgi:hypothetical protein
MADMITKTSLNIIKKMTKIEILTINIGKMIILKTSLTNIKIEIIKIKI